ncbi:MAG: DUF5674 family protein [Candidatus Jorgensenbacteria bacterium]
MDIKVIKDSIGKNELEKIASAEFGEVVKAVVDTEQELMAIGGELHSDEEVLLAEKFGSKREYLWGINLYPKKFGGEWIEFDSMINIKPALGNRSRGVEDVKIREKVIQVVNKLVQHDT